MIIQTWHKIDNCIIRNMAQKTFETLFINELCLLKFIGLEKFTDVLNFNQWKQTSQFKIHLQVLNLIFF